MRVSVSPIKPLCILPDVTVACSKPLFRDDTLDTLSEPSTYELCEVLSPTTRDYDRRRQSCQLPDYFIFSTESET